MKNFVREYNPLRITGSEIKGDGGGSSQGYRSRNCWHSFTYQYISLILISIIQKAIELVLVLAEKSSQ